ncbi:AraC family transcriptional regulator [Actinosynnema sp. NPDC020468]|uniref:AraC family transcriptional regulator n=1 Tax=Actinosynnema sp. NPDC020468 TaxID=3154488 RepID=UPI0033E46BD8
MSATRWGICVARARVGRGGPLARTTELGSVTVHQVVPASQPHVVPARPGHHALVLSASGVLVVERDGREVVVDDEGIALSDVRRSLEIRPCGPGAEAVVMVFPNSAAPLLPPPAPVARHEVCDLTGPGALLCDLLAGATVAAPALHASEAARIGDAALHLATGVLERHFSGPGDGVVTHQHELLTRIRGYVDRHLGDHTLTPSRVAAAHHVSVRYLQRLFKIDGATPSGWIRSRRLEICRRELADEALRGLSIREIGLRNGFPQASDFSRAFRAEYGRPPGRFRAELRSTGTWVGNQAVASGQ